MRFHIQSQSYQFKALPFGLSIAPMEFTVVAKEYKPMALQRGIKIHTDLGSSLSRTRLAGEQGEVRTGPKTGFQLHRLPVRPQVTSRKQVAHKSLGTKGGLSGPKRVPRPLFKQHSPGSHRQHNSGCLYQERRGMKSGSLCALLWRILSWCTRKQVTLKAHHIPGQLNGGTLVDFRVTG